VTEPYRRVDPQTPEPTDGRWLTPGVLGVGGASLFSDASHELVTSLLPTFLTATLHAGPGALGAIDGTADALTGLARLAGGPLSNDPARRSHSKDEPSGYIENRPLRFRVATH
jgi:hypothetical protein